jgi:hypothetical protein
MVLLVLVLHWFFIDMVSMRRRYNTHNKSNSNAVNFIFSFKKDVLMLHFTAFMEVLISGLLSLLFTEPFGKFAVQSCRVRTLSDWYTLLHNPSPNYDQRVHCTQEAVYPL